MIVAPGAGVDADEQDDAGAVGDRLLGLRLLLRRVALGVHDVVLDAGLLEGLLEVAPVVRLPPRRAGAVGQEHPDASLAAAVTFGSRACVTTASFVVAAAAGRDRREREDEREEHDDEPPPSSTCSRSVHEFLTFLGDVGLPVRRRERR